jgi:hypothetical protein
VLDRPEVVGNRLVYPAEAPSLAPGTRYTLRVLAGGQSPQESWFEASNGLPRDARKQVVEALAAAPDDPALHTLQGARYERGGLRQQTARAYQEA